MVAHLMRFVELGDANYARYAAKRYAKTDPFNLAELPAVLDVEIARSTTPMSSSGGAGASGLPRSKDD